MSLRQPPEERKRRAVACEKASAPASRVFVAYARVRAHVREDKASSRTSFYERSTRGGDFLRAVHA